jgi:hypothetical protein
VPLPVSRRAERFAAALDGDPSVDDAATQRLVGTTARLGALQVTGPARSAAGRAAVVAAASGALVEAARHAAAPAAHAAASTGAASAAPTAAAHAIAQAVALKAITGIVALAVIGGGVEVAAQRSLPGQPFYGLKQATESAQLHLSGGSTAKAEQRLDQARTRLAEIKALWPEKDSTAHSQQIADLITALDKDVALATRPLLAAGGSAAAQLRATVNELQTELAALPHTLTGIGATAVAASVSNLGSLTAAVTGLATLVPGSGPSGVFPAVPTAPVQVVPLPSTSSTPGGAKTVTPGPSTRPTTAPTRVVPSTPTGVLPSGVRPSTPTGVLPSAVLPPLTVLPLPTAPLSPPPTALPSVLCTLSLGTVCLP